MSCWKAKKKIFFHKYSRKRSSAANQSSEVLPWKFNATLSFIETQLHFVIGRKITEECQFTVTGAGAAASRTTSCTPWSRPCPPVRSWAPFPRRVERGARWSRTKMSTSSWLKRSVIYFWLLKLAKLFWRRMKSWANKMKKSPKISRKNLR